MSGTRQLVISDINMPIELKGLPNCKRLDLYSVRCSSVHRREGEDTLAGGRGNDRIDARDGEPDTINCGANLFDTLSADPAGEASVVGCPTV